MSIQRITKINNFEAVGPFMPLTKGGGTFMVVRIHDVDHEDPLGYGKSRFAFSVEGYNELIEEHSTLIKQICYCGSYVATLDLNQYSYERVAKCAMVELSGSIASDDYVNASRAWRNGIYKSRPNLSVSSLLVPADFADAEKERAISSFISVHTTDYLHGFFDTLGGYRQGVARMTRSGEESMDAHRDYELRQVLGKEFGVDFLIDHKYPVTLYYHGN